MLLAYVLILQECRIGQPHGQPSIFLHSLSSPTITNSSSVSTSSFDTAEAEPAEALYVLQKDFILFKHFPFYEVFEFCIKTSQQTSANSMYHSKLASYNPSTLVQTHEKWSAR